MNIAGLTAVDDPSYRYKMPRLKTKVEGRGNGIKTVLENVVELGNSLNREAPEITKFFGCELGSQTTYATDTDRAIVNGSHTANDLQEKLKLYIQKFVLCGNCRLPETHYKIKSDIISQKCLACGHKEAVDMTHRLAVFILAQNKKATELKKEKKSKDEKEEKKKDKKEKVEKVAGAAETEEEKTEKKAKKEKSEKTEKKEKKEKSEKTESGESPKKEKSKKKKSSEEGVGENVFGIQDQDESDSAAAEDAINRFRQWKSDHPEATVKEVSEQLRMLQTSASLSTAYRAVIFIGALFTEAAITGEEVKTYKDNLAPLADSAIKQRQLIAATEWFCGVRFPSLLPRFPLLLKQLFDEDIVEEDTFLIWNDDNTRNQYSFDEMVPFETLEKLKETTAPFITWLEEAEEEESDEEEEGDEEEEA